MSSPPLLPIAALAACSLVGGYAGMYSSLRDGFFDALGTCVDGAAYAAGKCILSSAPDPATVANHYYTGFAGLDKQIAVLLEFFAQGLEAEESAYKPERVAALLTASYLMALFGGVWFLVLVESLRKGNAGSGLTWTGLVGMGCQFVTVTVVSPLYWIGQLFRYTAVTPTWSRVAVDNIDLYLLPFSMILGFVAPSIGMVLPGLLGLSARAKYIGILQWQPFPIYINIIHATLRSIFGSSSSTQTSNKVDSKKARAAFRWAYAFPILITAVPHLLILGRIGQAFLEHNISPLESLSLLLAPHSILEPPTKAVATPPVSAETGRDIVGSFLRWDIYCASTAALVWATYVSYRTSRGKGPSEVISLLAKVVLGVLVAGPVAPAAVLLWERDLVLLDEATSKATRAQKNR